jgi:hypothetical protein
MSERSESLHFWRLGFEDVRRLMVSQNVGGRIVACNDRWLCFVPFDQLDEDRVIANSRGLVLKWSYDDNYGLGLMFYSEGKELGQAAFIWGDEPPSASLPAQLASALRSFEVASTNLGEIERIAQDVLARRVIAPDVRDGVGRALGLAAYEWLSPQDCLGMPIEAFRENFPDAEDIDAGA